MAGITDDEEARQFILHHLKLAGRSDPLFEEQAILMIKQLGQGLPRKMGNLALTAMTLAMVKKVQIINSDLIVKAADGI